MRIFSIDVHPYRSNAAPPHAITSIGRTGSSTISQILHAPTPTSTPLSPLQQDIQDNCSGVSAIERLGYDDATHRPAYLGGHYFLAQAPTDLLLATEQVVAYVNTYNTYLLPTTFVEYHDDVAVVGWTWHATVRVLLAECYYVPTHTFRASTCPSP